MDWSLKRRETVQLDDGGSQGARRRGKSSGLNFRSSVRKLLLLCKHIKDLGVMRLYVYATLCIKGYPPGCIYALSIEYFTPGQSVP